MAIKFNIYVHILFQSLFDASLAVWLLVSCLTDNNTGFIKFWTSIKVTPGQVQVTDISIKMCPDIDFIGQNNG